MKVQGTSTERQFPKRIYRPQRPNMLIIKNNQSPSEIGYFHYFQNLLKRWNKLNSEKQEQSGYKLIIEGIEREVDICLQKSLNPIAKQKALEALEKIWSYFTFNLISPSKKQTISIKHH